MRIRIRSGKRETRPPSPGDDVFAGFPLRCNPACGPAALTNPSETLKGIVKEYGSNMVLVGHSRGGMTIGNTLESVSNEGTNPNLDIEVKLFGSAANAQDVANTLLSLGSQTTSVESYVHTDDFVGTLIGNNAATYGIRPKENTKIEEWINMFNDYPTVHSCYGALASLKCKEKYGEQQTKIYNPIAE